MSRLVTITPGLTGFSHELGTHWVTIGRADGNAFQIVETSVSGHHCEVRLRGNELDVRDLRSTNGTFIEGKLITEAVLQPGQILRLGEVQLQLEIAAPAPAGTTPAIVPSTNTPAPVRKPGAAGGSTMPYRILFVDDSMAFLETISELFGDWGNKLWEIHTAAAADKALAILQQKLMDLVVLDIGMPLLDGIQLLGVIHQRHPNIKIVVLTGQNDENQRANCLAKGAELFLIKPTSVDGLMPVFNMLNALVTWTDREGFSGALGQIGLPSIIQMECLEGKSSVLEIRNAQIDGEIFIEAGAIIHAATGRLTGEKAFHQLLALASGDFCLKPFRAPSERTLHDPWETLLAQTVRVQDEGNFSGGENDTILIVKKPAPGKPVTATSPVSSTETSAPPPKLAPVEPPQPKPRRSIAGMNFITLEEMVEAETDLIHNPNSKGPPPDNSNN